MTDVTVNPQDPATVVVSDAGATVVVGSVSAALIAAATVLAVANIDDPSAELSVIAGAQAGETRLCYQAVAGANEWTLYAWDSSSSAGASTPYRINGTTGQWQAVAGKYGNSARSFNSTVNIAGVTTVTNSTAATTPTAAALVVTGGIASGQSIMATTGFAIQRAAGNVRDIVWYSGTSQRWLLRCSSTAESGGSAGSDLSLIATADDGSTSTTVFSATRAAGGSFSISRPVTVGGFQNTAINLTASSSYFWLGSTSDTTKFNSQGVAWSTQTGPAIIFDGNSSDRPEISWIRGANTYPEFSIREHTTANSGGEIYVGSGSSAPTRTVRFVANEIGLDASASGVACSYVLATAGSARWRIRKESTAESGSNAGSQFQISAYDDTGTAIDTPFQINRVSGGTITLARVTSVSDSTDATSTTAAALKTSGGIAAAKALIVGTNATVGAGTAAASITINGATATFRSLNFQTAGSNRWIARANSTAEGGSNAGSDFEFLARADDGTAIDTVMSCTRASGGTMTIVRPVSLSSTITVTGAATLNNELILGNAVSAQETSKTSPVIYATAATGGAYPFLGAGNLIISPRISGATRDVLIWPNSTAPSAVFFGSGRVAINGTTDDGSTTVNITGTLKTTGLATLQNIQVVNELTFGAALSALDTAQTTPVIYNTNGSGGAYPFNGAGHLIISPRLSGANRDVLIYPNGTAPSAVFFNSGRVAINSTTDDGTNAFQVTGSASITSGVKQIRTLRFTTTGINVNSAATDVGTLSSLPAKWRFVKFTAYDASTSLTTATVDLRTATGGGGTALVSAAGMASCTAAAKFQDLTAAAVTGTDYQTATTLTIRNVTAQGSAATVSFQLEIIDLT